jgi:S1-C subfamily serine protease
MQKKKPLAIWRSGLLVGAVKPHSRRTAVANKAQRLENLYERGGAVTRVQPDSVAARVGIQPEDRIMAFDSHAINRASDLVDAVSKIEPGAAVALEIARGNRRLRLTASFYERQDLAIRDLMG